MPVAVPAPPASVPVVDTAAPPAMEDPEPAASRAIAAGTDIRAGTVDPEAAARNPGAPSTRSARVAVSATNRAATHPDMTRAGSNSVAASAVAEERSEPRVGGSRMQARPHAPGRTAPLVIHVTKCGRLQRLHGGCALRCPQRHGLRVGAVIEARSQLHRQPPRVRQQWICLRIHLQDPVRAARACERGGTRHAAAANAYLVQRRQGRDDAEVAGHFHTRERRKICAKRRRSRAVQRRRGARRRDQPTAEHSPETRHRLAPVRVPSQNQAEAINGDEVAGVAAQGGARTRPPTLPWTHSRRRRGGEVTGQSG